MIDGDEQERLWDVGNHKYFIKILIKYFFYKFGDLFQGTF